MSPLLEWILWGKELFPSSSSVGSRWFSHRRHSGPICWVSEWMNKWMHQWVHKLIKQCSGHRCVDWGSHCSDDLLGNFIFFYTNYQENWYFLVDLEKLSKGCGLLIQDLVVLSLGPLGPARQASHPCFPCVLTWHIFVFYPKANSLPQSVWVQEETPLGNLPRFICSPFSILACHPVIFGKVLL